MNRANPIREYSITLGRNYVETMRVPGHLIQRTTPKLGKWMKWMSQEEPDSYTSLFVGWWEHAGTEIKCGHFNEELYRRVLKAKKERGELS